MTSSCPLYDVHRNLARAIEENLALLGGPKLLAHVDVFNVDRLGPQVVREADGGQPKVAYAGAVAHLPEGPSHPKSSGLDAVFGLNFALTGRQHPGRAEAAAPFDRVQFF